jgi:hypothetical protein
MYAATLAAALAAPSTTTSWIAASTAGVSSAAASGIAASTHSSAPTAAATPLLALLSGADGDLLGPWRVGQHFGDFLARPLRVVFGFPKIRREQSHGAQGAG